MSRPMLTILGAICFWPVRVARTRRIYAELAALDDRGLADIGLGRHDLRDMTAYSLDDDPTSRLAERARERAQAALAARLERRPQPWPPGQSAPSGGAKGIAA